MKRRAQKSPLEVLGWFLCLAAFLAALAVMLHSVGCAHNPEPQEVELTWDDIEDFRIGYPCCYCLESEDYQLSQPELIK